MADYKNLETDYGGYDCELFVNQDLCQKYECAMCLCVMKNPMDINCNESHNFCKNCIDELSQNYNNTIVCPLCQQNVKLRGMKVNKFVQRLMYNELIVKSCIHKCSLKHIKLGVYVKHLNDGCPNELIPCQYKCNTKIMKKNMLNHKLLCKNRELMELNISNFIKPGYSNFQIAEAIRGALQKPNDGNIVVVVSNENEEWGHVSVSSMIHFKRKLTCNGKKIQIRKVIETELNIDKMEIMNQDIFTSFVKGLIIDGKTSKEIRHILHNIFGGVYLIARNIAIACDYFGDHECKFMIHDYKYACLRVG